MKNKIIRNRKGAALLTVITFMLIVVAMSGLVLSLAMYSSIKAKATAKVFDSHINLDKAYYQYDDATDTGEDVALDNDYLLHFFNDDNLPVQKRCLTIRKSSAGLYDDKFALVVVQDVSDYSPLSYQYENYYTKVVDTSHYFYQDILYFNEADL